MPITPQAGVRMYAAMRVNVSNHGTRTWFEHEIDLMSRKGNGLKDMSKKIDDRCNKFTFLVFKKLEESTGSWLAGNEGARHHADIKDIHDRACNIKDEIQQEHQLSNRRAGEYEGQVPAIHVSVGNNSVQITSDDWLDVVVSVYDIIVDMNKLRSEIKYRFDVFDTMLFGKLEREIKNTLLRVESAFFRDRRLSAVKTDFDQRMTVQILELKKWIERVNSKTSSDGMPNPNYIPGMDVLAGWDLTVPGRRVQVYAIRAFHNGSTVSVLGVENQPHRPSDPNTGKKYDADIWVECDKKNVPIQVGVREGELARKVSDASVVSGERTQPNEAVSEFGGTDMDYGKEPDWAELRKKLGQVPSGGVVLWVTAKELLPNSSPVPLKEWYGEPMDEKCVIVWVPDENKAVIHHNNTGFDLNLAKKMCAALGVAEPDEQTDSEDGRTEGYAQGVEGVLSRLAYMSGYMGWRNPSPVVLANDLVPILHHVVEMYKKSVAENTDDGEKWRRYVSKVLSMLEKEAKTDNIKLDSSIWVEICHILQYIATMRHADDDYLCEGLWIDNATTKQHLHALLCLTCVMIYKLRDKTPPAVLETLTAAARLCGQDGREHRIVLGFALMIGLRSAIPNWYAENEPLLFGKDAPDGLNTTLVRICSLECPTGRTNAVHYVLDTPTMEKYHTVVLDALVEEMHHVRSLQPKTRRDMEANALVGHFMWHVLRGSRGYGIGDSIRYLSQIGPDVLSVAGRECWFLIKDKNTEKEIVDRAVRFWEAVLDSSPKPESLCGFGWLCYTESIDRDIMERLMLRTCELAGGMMDLPVWVISHVWPDGNQTETGKHIIKILNGRCTTNSTS